MYGAERPVGDMSGALGPVFLDLNRLLPQEHAHAINSFRFNKTIPLLGRFQDAAAVCIFYFMLLRVLKSSMKNQKALELRTLVTLHSAFLTVVSFALLSGFVLVLAEKMHSYTLWETICSESFHDDGRLQTLYYLNYLVKWYELLDTVILVLRKKPVIFLHEYHHAATLFLCWIQLDQHSSVQWVPITINLLVHVIMYYYYTLSSLKIHVWWKKYLTQFQIVQFVIDIAACVYASSHEPVVGGLGLSWLQRPHCNGTLKGATWGVGIIFSYLILFIVFYFQTYNNHNTYKSQPPPSAAEAKKSHAAASSSSSSTIRTRSKKD